MAKDDIKNFLKDQNIEVKINSNIRKAEGNLFKKEKKPIVSNHRTIKLGKTINGKVDLNKKDDLKVKPGQIISGKISLNKK